MGCPQAAGASLVCAIGELEVIGNLWPTSLPHPGGLEGDHHSEVRSTVSTLPYRTGLFISIPISHSPTC